MSAIHLYPEPEDIPLYPGGGGTGSYRDLCSTCDHSQACQGRGTLEHPILFCEEFEALTAGLGPGDGHVSTEARETRVAGRRLGLCVNCDNTETCRMPRPEGGIWHCQAYS